MKTLMVMLALLIPAAGDGKSAEEGLKEALASAKESKRRVFLTFGGPGCGWCVRFEAWKALPDVAPLLAKDFVLLHVDLDKTPGGRALHEGYPKAKQGGIPWFVVLDAQGGELGDSNGPAGNIGCPNTDEEIAYFMSLLQKVCVVLGDDERASLKKSLVAFRDRK